MHFLFLQVNPILGLSAAQWVTAGTSMLTLIKVWGFVRRANRILDQHNEMWAAHVRYKQWQEHEAWQENDWRNRGSRWNSS